MAHIQMFRSLIWILFSIMFLITLYLVCQCLLFFIPMLFNCVELNVMHHTLDRRRLLKTRIDEHRSHIRRNTNQSSVITEHRLEFSHDFDWNNVEILDEKIHFNKRIISEMIHIKKQSYSLNLQHDTDSLDSIYFDIIR